MTKKAGLHYSTLTVQPQFLISQKFEQIVIDNETERDLITLGKSLIGIDTETCHVISYEVIEQAFHIYDLVSYRKPGARLFSFVTDENKDEEISLRRKLSGDEEVLLTITEDQKKLFLNPSISFKLDQGNSFSSFDDLFHPFFLDHFKADLSKALLPDENITESTMAYHRKVEAMYIFGTTRGRILIFKLFYSTNDKIYSYYTINFDDCEINILYVRKSLLFASSVKGKLGVYSIAINDINRASLQSDAPLKQDRDNKIREINVSTLQQFESSLVSPLKRVLRVKLLQSTSSNQQNENDENYLESIEKCKQQIALILKNNSLVIFSCLSKKIEFECKMNETSVLGVFIHPLLDYLLILNANGNINIYSTNTGRYERTVTIIKYSSLLNIPSLLATYSEHYVEQHRYSTLNESINRYGSKVHGILEYNSRYLKNFLFGMDKEKDKNEHSKYKILSERLGNLDQISSSRRENPQIVWLLHYSSDFIYASKYKRSGVAFLNLFLDSPIRDEGRLGSIAHILVIDAKTCLSQKSQHANVEKKVDHTKQTDEFRLSRKKSNRFTLDSSNSRVTFIPFLFPWGIDSELDEEIIQLCGYKVPVFDFYYGVQGIGETFSFILSSEPNQSSSVSTEINLPEDKLIMASTKGVNPKLLMTGKINWQTSNYYTTIQALGFMVSY